MEQISISEARQQLQAAEDEVARIRQRISELRDSDNVLDLARRERELAQQLLDGADPGGIVAVPLTSAQLRKAISVLESALAEALERERWARGAVRKAQVERMRELLEERKAAFDERAEDLLRAYCDTTALADELSRAVGSVPQLPLVWGRLAVPKPVTDHSIYATGMHPSGPELMSGLYGNRARTELAEVLKREGIE